MESDSLIFTSKIIIGQQCVQSIVLVEPDVKYMNTREALLVTVNVKCASGQVLVHCKARVPIVHSGREVLRE